MSTKHHPTKIANKKCEQNRINERSENNKPKKRNKDGISDFFVVEHTLLIKFRKEPSYALAGGLTLSKSE